MNIMREMRTEMLKESNVRPNLVQYQHDKEESMHYNRSWQVYTIGCHPEFISGSQGMLKQVQHDKKR